MNWKNDPGEVARRLREANPNATAQQVALYADAFCEYQAAAANIRKHGSIVYHPRTGAPVDNPFVKVRDAARRTLEAMTKPGTRLKRLDELWSVDEDSEADE